MSHILQNPGELVELQPIGLLILQEGVELMRLNLHVAKHTLVVGADTEPTIFKPLRPHLFNKHDCVCAISDMVLHQVLNHCEEFGINILFFGAFR